MHRVCTYLIIMGLWISVGVLFAVDVPIPAENLPRLDQLAMDVPIAIRMVDGEEIMQAKLVSVDAVTLNYDNGFKTVRVERWRVYKAVQNHTSYSDYPIRKIENTAYPSYETFIFERGDILIESHGKKTFGLIISVTPDQFVMRTDSGEISVPRERVVAWRKSGVSFGQPEAKVEKKDAMPKQDPHKETPFPIEITGFLAGPWLPFPQAGLGIVGNATWPVSFGLRGTLGSMDSRTFALLKQVSIFTNFHFARSGEYSFFAGASLLWRTGRLVDKFYAGTIEASITQTRYSLYLGFRTDKTFMEAGVEMGISNERTYSEPTAQSITDASNIRYEASRVQSSLRFFDTMSQLHFVMGIWF